MPVSDQGANLERYMFIPRTLVFITRGNKLLLLRGDKDKRLWPGLYNGIGGHVEQGEDILAAAQRELFEETGMTSCNLWLCGITVINTRTNPGVCIYIFRGECGKSEFVLSKEGDLQWINISDFHNLPLVPDLPALLPRILNMSKGESPFSAYSEYNNIDELVITIK
jgi:8-oxo-dGTP diphosphatase